MIMDIYILYIHARQATTRRLWNTSLDVIQIEIPISPNNLNFDYNI